MQKVEKHRRAHPLMGFRPAHPTPPKGAGLSGQIVRYLNRTYRLLPTSIANEVAKNQNTDYNNGMKILDRDPEPIGMAAEFLTNRIRLNLQRDPEGS